MNDMNELSQANVHTCPRCGVNTEDPQLSQTGYHCPQCNFEMAHVDTAPNGSIRGVFGYLLCTGQIIQDRYLIQRVLGKGGFGATYLVEDLRLKGRRRALKEVPELLFDEHEVELLSHLNHPAIPDITDRFVLNGMVYLVLEFGGRQTLGTECERLGGRIPLPRLMPFMSQLCDALAYLHAQDPPIIHRDLKPDNVLLDEHDRIMLIDFGISKESAQGMTRTVARAASHGFSPPEQVLGTGTDERSDIYSFGATLYYLLTGRIPPAAHERVAGKEIEPPSTFIPGLPPEVDDVLSNTLSLNLNQRPAKITDLKHMIGTLSALTLPDQSDTPLQTMRLGADPGVLAVSGSGTGPGGIKITTGEAMPVAPGGPSEGGKKKGMTAVIAIAVVLAVGVAAAAGAYFVSRGKKPAKTPVEASAPAATQPPVAVQQPAVPPSAPAGPPGSGQAAAPPAGPVGPPGGAQGSGSMSAEEALKANRQEASSTGGSALLGAGAQRQTAGNSAPITAQNGIFSEEQLDRMVAPIALYPDPLLAQVLMAATYPDQVTQADAWLKNNRGLKGDALNDELDKMDWDTSVKALAPFPQVLGMMGGQPDWTQNLGDAFLAQQSDVMDAVQRLRSRAQAAGNLKSGDQEQVLAQNGVIEIDPVNPEVVYVPRYDPQVVYGTWWWPEPPLVYYPVYDGVVVGPVGVYGFWPAAVEVGPVWGCGWGSWNWAERDVSINVNRTVNINRNVNVSSFRGSMQTNSFHRMAVGGKIGSSGAQAAARNSWRTNPKLMSRGSRGTAGGVKAGGATPALGHGGGNGAAGGHSGVAGAAQGPGAHGALGKSERAANRKQSVGSSLGSGSRGRANGSTSAVNNGRGRASNGGGSYSQGNQVRGRAGGPSLSGNTARGRGSNGGGGSFQGNVTRGRGSGSSSFVNNGRGRSGGGAATSFQNNGSRGRGSGSSPFANSGHTGFANRGFGSRGGSPGFANGNRSFGGAKAFGGAGRVGGFGGGHVGGGHVGGGGHGGGGGRRK
jgi:hypothetical protein